MAGECLVREVMHVALLVCEAVRNGCCLSLAQLSQFGFSQTNSSIFAAAWLQSLAAARLSISHTGQTVSVCVTWSCLFTRRQVGKLTFDVGVRTRRRLCLLLTDYLDSIPIQWLLLLKCQIFEVSTHAEQRPTCRVGN